MENDGAKIIIEKQRRFEGQSWQFEAVSKWD
jgi:hypothetical protein